MLRAVMDDATAQRWLDETPFHAHLGTLRIATTDDGVRIDADLAPSTANDAKDGVTHGGVLATLLDTALTFALIVGTDEDWSTVDLRVDFLRPVPVGATVRVDARVVQSGWRVGRAEGSVIDAEDRVCARGVATFIRAT
jgi:uncharacterized protein (TIGR00369 family)